MAGKNNTMNVPKHSVSAIITAAGDGTRMGGVSKPLIMLGGRTVLEYVLDAFSASEYINEIVIACRDSAQIEPYADKYRSQLPVRLVAGGAVRGESVFNAVSAADPSSKAYAIHDCARPLIRMEFIDTVIEAAFETGAATASSPVTDTIKYISDDGTVKTPKRSALYAVQTPQVFLRDVYLVSAALAKKNRYTATDDTALAEKAGFKVKYVSCDEPNLKLTTPQDIIIAEALLKARSVREI